jgi:hypothetical protein
MTDVAKDTILTLLEELGTACIEFHNRTVRGVKSRRVQCDEIWQFCYAKEKNVPSEKKGEFGYGDVWTWTAVDADTKLTISYLVGKRDAGCAYEFMQDLAGRLANRAGGAYVPTVFVGMYATQGRYNVRARALLRPQSSASFDHPHLSSRAPV